MRSVKIPSVSFGMAVLLAANASPPQGTISTDGAVAPARTSVSYVFDCGGMSRTTFEYVQSSREPSDNGDVAQARTVELARLHVDGREVPAEGLRRVGEALDHFAWIERVVGQCYRDEILLRVAGMPRLAWARHVREDGMEVPAMEHRILTVARDGAVTVQD